MHKIEILKSLLSLYVFRTFRQEPESRSFGCLHPFDAIVNINKRFPEYSLDFLFQTISKNIIIKEGKLTSFIWGYSKCVREIFNFEFKEEL